MSLFAPPSARLREQQRDRAPDGALRPRASCFRDSGTPAVLEASRPHFAKIRPLLLPETERDTSAIADSVLQLLQTQRYEAKFSLRIGDQKQRRFATFLLELVDPLLQRIRIGDRLLRHLDHHVAGIKPLIGC